MEQLELPNHIHRFPVDNRSKPKNDLLTNRNLYVKFVEGIEFLDHPAYSVQYHAEAAPGSRDTSYLFGRFLEKIKS